VPIHRGCVVVAARGVDRLEAVDFAPCDGEWNPDRSRISTAEVDTLCVGFGFVPRAQLAQLAGCAMRFAPELGGWLPAVDENLETSVPDVWVAGDGGGVAGATAAALEGRLAGLVVAHRLGALDASAFAAARRPIDARLARHRRFRAALDDVSKPRPGLVDLATAETICCRCEELTRAEIDVAITAGGAELRSLKAMTRIGMGPCQGRMCWPAAARYLSARTGRSPEGVGPLSVRAPIQPVEVGKLARAAPSRAADGSSR
jgi:NADPH-dependent 2,4-dienoyl-CoA reductase/sulfur reductase-like enzyme